VKSWNWLWDYPNLSEKQIKACLKDPDNSQFLFLASKLLARNEDAEYVFKLLDRKTFCEYWPVLKRRIQREGWFSGREDLWQKQYDRTLEQLKKKGVRIHTFPEEGIPELRMRIAMRLREIREDAGYTQFQAARLLGVRQQYISLVETGRENLSIDTLYKIANTYLKRVDVMFTG